MASGDVLEKGLVNQAGECQLGLRPQPQRRANLLLSAPWPGIPFLPAGLRMVSLLANSCPASSAWLFLKSQGSLPASAGTCTASTAAKTTHLWKGIPCQGIAKWGPCGGKISTEREESESEQAKCKCLDGSLLATSDVCPVLV